MLRLLLRQAGIRSAVASRRVEAIQLQGGRGFKSTGWCARENGTSAGAASTARQPWLVTVAAGLSAGLGLQLYNAGRGSGGPAECHAADDESGQLPEYSKEEVASHRTKEDKIWVTYKDGVYDVTEWVDIHPGGTARIMLAAGGPIDPFWAMYQQHNTAQVHEILKGYRIGRLKGGAPPPTGDPYAKEPTDRSPALIVRSTKPMNSETPKELLAASLITPTELFYVRNHLPVPEVDEETYRLQVEGQGLRAVNLSLNELKTKFKKHEVTATVQCTGNRRVELQSVKPIKGLEWEGGSISTAVWGGVRLRDVLKYAGLDDDDQEVDHIQFEGLDTDLERKPYGASIPVSKAMDPHGDVLLAYEMNGATLPRDHGYPIRVLVPGTAGCRSVKWLARIIASHEESHSFWQRSDYKSFSPSVDWDNVDWDSAPSIQAMPITSLICEPSTGDKVDDEEFTVKGYAWSGGGQGIIRVDVSADGGKTWHTAELKKVPQKPGRGWAWALWTATVPVPEGHNGTLELVCKATDESYNTQPEQPGPIWNLRGVNCNSWHRVTVEVE